MPTNPNEGIHSRAHIALNTQSDLMLFMLAASKYEDVFVVEDERSTRRVNASSMLGMAYATSEFGNLYLVNESRDGVIPSDFDRFRI